MKTSVSIDGFNLYYGCFGMGPVEDCAGRYPGLTEVRAEVSQCRLHAIERFLPIMSQGCHLEFCNQHPDECCEGDLPGRQVQLVEPDLALRACVDLGGQ
jgi:hypothetical protein